MAEGKPKYLAIRNWRRYQLGAKPDKNGRLPYIRDYTNREDDPEFQKLTLVQRAVLEGLCRACGKQPTRLLHNDPEWLVNVLIARPKDRHNVPGAVEELTRRGFLFPTDDENFMVCKPENGAGVGLRAPQAAKSGSFQSPPDDEPDTDFSASPEGSAARPPAAGDHESVGFDVPEEDL